MVRALLLGVVGAAALVGCGKGEPAADEAAVELGAMLAAVDQDGPVRRIQVVGPAGGLPEGLLIRLGAPRFEAKDIGQPAPAGMEWRMEPGIEADLVVAGPDLVELRPRAPFAPSTDYRFELTKLRVGDADLTPPSPDAWSYSFRTADFGLLRASPRRFAPDARAIEIDLRFSGIIQADAVLPLLRLTGPHGGPVSATGEVLSDGRTLRLLVRDAAAMVEGDLLVELLAGAPFAGDPSVKAPAARRTVKLSLAPPVEILAVIPKEGMQGFYLEIICKDPSAGEERWYWDRDTYDSWYVHERCTLDADALAGAVSLSPAVPFTIAPGPAGFRIMGELGQGVYNLSIAGGARTVDGGQLPADYSVDVTVPKRRPSVRFVNKGRYLPHSAWRSLPIQALNSDSVKVQVRHVPPENLVFWLSGDEAANERTANIISETVVPLPMREDVSGTHYLDLQALVPEAGRGVYELSITGAQGGSDAARIVLTDHQIIAKRGVSTTTGDVVRPAPLWLWTRDVHTGGPASGVELRAVRRSGQTVGRCLTDGDGFCAIELEPDPLNPEEPFAIIAQKGDDLTFLRFEDLLLQSDADTSGERWSSEGEQVAYRAGLYTDRGVYRPGDVVHLGGLLRDPEGQLLTDRPRALVRFIDARGNEVRRTVVNPDVHGHLTADLPLADFAATGRYHARLEVAERTVGELSFSVEEFVPERMSVTATPAARAFAANEPAVFSVAGRWLFGGSAAGSAVELSCRVEPGRFQPKGYEGFHFGGAEQAGLSQTSVRVGGQRSQLNDEGTAQLSCAPGAEAAAFGAAEVVAEVAVFEGGGGRATRTTARAPVHPAPFYIGAKANKTVLRRGDLLEVEGRLVGVEGAALSSGGPGRLEVELVRLDEEMGWFWDDEEGSGQLRRSLRRISEGRRFVDVQGDRFSFQWPVAGEAAGWLVVVSSGAARTELYVEGSAHRYFWEDGEEGADQTPRPARPTPLALSAPDQVEVGDRFEVRATAPYAGWVLWTLESDRVLSHRWERVAAGEIAWSPKIGEFVPNAFVTAFLIKDPHLESAAAFIPGRAYGARSVRVRPARFEQAVAMEVPAELLPWSPLEVKLNIGKVKGGATATVAVVDEGILQLTDFETPNPLRQVFARRRLGVSSFETVGWTLMMEPGGPSSRTGGDGAGGSMGRVQMVKPVSLWSGPVSIGEDGLATVKLDVPGYRGKLRVMAVVAAGERVGSAEATVVVRDPLVLQATVPRVLATHDEVDLPVFVSNQTGKAQEVELQLAVTGLAGAQQLGLPEGEPPVKLLGADRTTLKLAAGEGGSAVFRLRSDAVSGAARIVVTASGGGHRSRDEFDLPLVPDRSEERRSQRLPLGALVDLDAALDAGGWVDGADRTQVLVTTNPYIGSLAHISDLIRYPYGCVEQTVSSTRPLLALRALMPSIDADLVAQRPVDERVRAGLDRVLSMQTPAGGFAYWPGGTSPSPWATAYATHLLLDAQEARFEVSAEALDEALSWIERSGLTAGGSDAAGTRAYMLYVLARAGRGRPAEAQRALETSPPNAGVGADLEAQYLLMAAVQRSGDRRHERALKAMPVPNFRLPRANDWSFYSELRRGGLMLSIFEELFPGDRAGEAMAEALAEELGRQSGAWYTTQELAWAIGALGKRASSGGSALPELILSADGQGRAAERTPAGPRWSLSGASGIAELHLSADSSVEGATVLVSTRGVRSTPERALSSSLVLGRSALNADGQPLDLAAHRLGDRLYLQVDIANRSKRPERNVALVARIPAGWEVESARVTADPFGAPGEARAAWAVEHLNIRDDRVELFGTVGAGASESVWLELRATSAGRFTWPATTAEAMYDPSIAAVLPGEPVTVLGPWAGSVL